MKPPLPLDSNDPEHDDSEYNERDREIIVILKDVGKVQLTYPPDRLAARRAAFLEHVERLHATGVEAESSAEHQEIVRLLGRLKSAEADYPPELLAARRAAFVRQVDASKQKSLSDRLRAFVGGLFPSNPKTTTSLPKGLRRLSPAIAGLVVALLIGALFLSRAEQTLSPSPSQTVATPTSLPTTTQEVGITICRPGEQIPSCPAAELDPSQDLADPQNGQAQPAVSSQSGSDGIHAAAYVNDGRSGTSWVSKSADSWVKIDLGKVKTINAVSLQKGNLGPSQMSDPGQFVIAVALSDHYADGNSTNDHIEYAQVFRSDQTGFSGTVSDAETILTQFPEVKARFVKITFAKAGAAIEEAGVFLVPPSRLAEQPTKKPAEEVPQVTATSLGTNTTSLETVIAPTTALPTHTLSPNLTNTPLQLDTSTSLPTLTLLPTDTPMPAPTEPLPSETPLPPPTEAPSLSISATAADLPVSSEPIIVTGHDQTLTFICNGNDVEIRGHANSVTLLGSCSSITVTGNRNRVVWDLGSPLIVNQGKDNLITQQ